MYTQIDNWNEVKEHFGLELAKKVSKNLQAEYNKHPARNQLEPMYDSEGYALFEKVHSKKLDSIVHFNFTGTAK